MSNIKDLIFGTFAAFMLGIAIVSLLSFYKIQSEEMDTILKNSTNNSKIITVPDSGEDANIFTKDEVISYIMSNPNVPIQIDTIIVPMDNFRYSEFNFDIIDQEYYKRESIIDNDGKLIKIKFISGG